MNLREAMMSGKPFTNPDTWGAYYIFNGAIMHRDNVNDYANKNNIEYYFSSTSPLPNDSLKDFTINDLIRDDWFIVNIQPN